MSSFKYPPQAANGKLVISNNATAEAISQAVQTRYGERVLRNKYGNDLDEFMVFTDLSTILQNLQEAIVDSTQEYRPISLALTGSIGDNGVISVNIEYDDDERTRTINIQL